RTLRSAERIKLLFRHHHDATVFAHADDIKSLLRVFIHPVLALELCDHALDRTLHAERLAATDALGRLLLFDNAGQGRSGTKIDLWLQAYHLFRAGRFAQATLHAGVLGKS